MIMWANAVKEILSVVTAGKRASQFIRKGQKVALAIAVGLMMIAGALTNIPAVILGRLVDDMLSDAVGDFAEAIPFLVVIALAIIVREVLTVGRKYLVENVCTQIEKDSTVRAVAHLLRLDMSFFSQHKVGALRGRLQRSTEGLVRLIKLAFLDFLPTLCAAAFALGVVIIRLPWFGLLMTGVIPAGFMIVLWQVTSQKGIRVSLLRTRETMDGTVVEVLGGIESVRAANTGSIETSKVEQTAESLRGKEIRHHLSMALFDSAKYVNEGAWFMAVISVAIYLATRGVISRGDILTYSMLYLSVMNPLREMHRVLDEAHESSIRVTDLFDLLAEKEDDSFAVTASACSLSWPETRPVIVAKAVTFRYPGSGRSDAALSNVSCEVLKGERIGVAGPSGSGKSTFIRLLLRLQHLSEGEILIGGLPIRELSREAIAASTVYVSQTPFVFSGTIRENLTYGCGDCAIELVIEAAKKAQIHEEIVDLGGYSANVAERGTNFSGGQKQRMALARIYLSAPEIVILDEATAALDNINEMAVQKTLEEAMQGRTVIMIAHRLSTLRDVDRILVFDRGRIVETGSYEQLIAMGGVFARLDQIARTVGR